MEKSQVYEAGYDCGLNGANTTNSNFKYFTSQESMQEWNRGKIRGAKDKILKVVKQLKEKR